MSVVHGSAISRDAKSMPSLFAAGMAYDEVNIVRFSCGGKKQCPVSGAVLECHRKGNDKGKIILTPDYALRNVIRHQATQAKVKPVAACNVAPDALQVNCQFQSIRLLVHGMCPIGNSIPSSRCTSPR
jgi:hypothetical protein